MTAVMVFAAGLGTRMRPLTDDRPKALVHVAGRPLIDHALEQVAGPGPIVVNAHHHAGKLEAHLSNRDVTVVTEHPDLLETGGGLKNARHHLGPDPILTMNSDAVWTGPQARTTLETAWQDHMDGLLLVVPAVRAIGHKGQDFGLSPNGRLTRDGLRDMAYTGAGLLRTDLLSGIDADIFSLWELWRPMLAKGTLFGVEHPGHWADVGTPDGIARAEAMLSQTA
ncbi:MAG: nucleotidyltransferase family protein [Pseudomonadota bacterium]